MNTNRISAVFEGHNNVTASLTSNIAANPEVMLRKGIYDKVAAKIIL